METRKISLPFQPFFERNWINSNKERNARVYNKSKEEEEEEGGGKRIIVGKDRRYSNAVVVASASAYCLYVRQHFYRLAWSRDNRKHLPFFFLPPSSSILENSTPVSPFSATCRAQKEKKRKKGEKREKRKRTDTSVPFRVHHQALLLIVGKYSGAVTRGEFLEAGEPLCLARTRRVVTAGIISVSRDYRRMLG